MVRKCFQFFRTNKIFLGSLLFLFFYSAGITLATPPVSKYQPGETLDPTCAPGDTNCSVEILPSQTGNSGKFLTTDGTNVAWETTTAGSVLFGGTTGGLTQDNANFFWNDTSNFLSVPKLQAFDASDLTITLGSNINGDTLSLSGGTAATDGEGGEINISSGNGNGVGTGGDIVLDAGNGGATGSGGAVTIDGGSGVVGGNIFLTGGTATTSSGGSLYLYGGNTTSGSGGNIQFVGGGSTAGAGGSLYFWLGNGAGTNNGKAQFFSNDSSNLLMTIANDGNVGIGGSAITNPAYRLDVLKDDLGQTATTRVANFSNANATFNTTSGARSSYVGYFSSTSTRSAGSNALTNIGLYATASGAQNNYAAIFDAGNVGIGNSTPTNKLDVTGYVNVDTNSGYKQAGNVVLYAKTSGANLGVGMFALDTNTSGQNNTAVGMYALDWNTTGSSNTAVGEASLTNSNGDQNTAVGDIALFFNDTGDDNVAVGYNTLFSNFAGNRNIAIGSFALSSSDSSNSTAIGYGALDSSSGANNIAVGYQAGENVTSGSNNLIFGYDVDVPSATASNQMVIGNLIFGTSIDGTGTTVSSGNIGIGLNNPSYRLDVLKNTTGQTASARVANFSNSGATFNTTSGNLISYGGYFSSISTESAGSNTLTNVGLYATASGADANYAAIFDAGNVGIGNTTPTNKLDVTGYINVDINSGYKQQGDVILFVKNSNNNITGVGTDALNSLTTGRNNTAVGSMALQTNTIGESNTGLGTAALSSNINGNQNTATGDSAMNFNETGNDNAAYGFNTLYANESGNRNSAFGSSALILATSSNNTAVGYSALDSVVGGANNIALGYQAGENITTGSNNLIIGYDIDAPSATSSNQLSIGNLIFGTSVDGTGTTVSAGNIGIGIATPSVKLEVNSGNTADGFRVGDSALSRFVTIGYQNTTSLFSPVSAAATGIISSPNNELQVNSNFGVNAGSASVPVMIIEGASGIASDYLQIRPNAGTSGTILTVDSSGEVGIGETTPTAILHLQGAGNTSSTFSMKVDNSSSSNVFVIRDDGRVGIGTGAPDTLLHPELNDAVTNDVSYPVRFTHRTTGTAAAGFGIGQEFQLENASGNNRVGASFQFIYTDPTDTSEDVDFALKLMDAGTITERFRIDSDGNVGIQQTSPGVALHVGSSLTADSTNLIRLQDTNSTCNFNADNGSPTCGSDRTLKKNIESLDIADLLTRVSALNPVSYQWETDDESSPTQYGFIAQEVEEQFPELVSEQIWIDGSTRKFLNMGGLMPYVVGAIKEIQLKVGSLPTEDRSLPVLAQDFFGSVVTAVEDGAAKLTALVTGKLTVGSSEKRTGVTLYDEETGEPYCLSIANGAQKITDGECSVVNAPEPVDSDPVVPESENNSGQPDTTAGDTQDNTGESSGENADLIDEEEVNPETDGKTEAAAETVSLEPGEEDQKIAEEPKQDSQASDLKSLETD